MMVMILIVMMRMAMTIVTACLQMKQKALMLAEMNAFLVKRQDEDEALKNEIEDLNSQFNKSVKVDTHLFIIAMVI